MLNRISTCPDRTFYRILFGCGLFLAATETYKQIFLYIAINGRQYDWFYFPFQLCSVPMYLCLSMPLLCGRRICATLCTFMQDFNLLGGIMALLVPEGFRHIHWTLTLHGYVWHVMLILIGLLAGLSGHTDLSSRGYLRTLPLFASCCLIATFINVAAPQKGRANMFYLSPYYPSVQMVFHGIALQYGILAGNLAYLAASCLGSWLIHLAMARVLPRYASRQSVR